MLLRKLPPISVEQLIRSGLPIGFRSMPTVLASYLAEANRPRRSRRLGVVGNIDDLGGNTYSNIQIRWSALRATGLPNTIVANQPNDSATAARQQLTYTFGTGVGQINQIAQLTQTVGTSATVNFAIDVWLKNVIGDASATFSAIKELWIELLTVAQGGGASASQVTFGNHATNAWAALLGATGTYVLKTGGMWHHQDQTAGGLSITTGDFLKMVNDDGANIASVRLTAFGLK
jgi:hypothetical protein